MAQDELLVRAFSVSLGDDQVCTAKKKEGDPMQKRINERRSCIGSPERPDGLSMYMYESAWDSFLNRAGLLTKTGAGLVGARHRKRTRRGEHLGVGAVGDVVPGLLLLRSDCVVGGATAAKSARCREFGVT